MSIPAAPRAGRGLSAAALASLVLMAMLWGSTFYMTKDLSNRIAVADLLAVRFVLATLAMALIGFRHLRMDAVTARHGALLGLVYGIAQLVQTTGLHLTSASTTGFITGLYVVITPFLAAWLLRERIPGLTWVAVLLALVGLGVMTLDFSQGLRMGTGEALTLLGAFLYAGHIVLVDRWTTAETSISMTIVQLAVVAVVCTLAALPDGIELPRGTTDWWQMFYLSVIAGAVPIFLQVWAQSIVESTTAAVLMAGEPVWAAVFAVLLGGEDVTWQMLVGGGSIFAAMILVTVLPRLRRPPRSTDALDAPVSEPRQPSRT